MAALSNYLENKVIDWLLRGQAFSPPATVYVALFTSDPTETGSGTEVSGGDYARVGVSSALTEWAGTQGAGTTTASSGTGGSTSNNNVITFASPTANWGTITHVALFDASSGGNLLIYGSLASSKVVNSGDAAPSFPAAALAFQLDN